MILSICICGAGTMGRGIALNCIINGLPASLYDPHLPALKEAEKYIQQKLIRLKEKGRLPTTPAAITYVNNIKALEADCFIEAIIEEAGAKVKLFKQLEALYPHAILATNTSSLSVNTIAASLKHPENFCGMHFFNPAHLMKLVEIVKGNKSSANTLQLVNKLAIKLGKTVVNCADSPGFIVNRVARPYYLEALYLLENYKIPFEVTDDLLEASGFKMGPFALMDLIGIDINYAVSVSVYEALQQPQRLKPSALQKEKLEEGNKGRKTGRGFYSY